ncbi:MAG: TraR/DksA C4-type zinc finger protein [Candidatus Omnitrophota bacterium]
MVKKKSTGKNQPFTENDLATIRRALVKKKALILEELLKIKAETLNKSLKDASGDLSGYSFHMADMATDLYDREFSLELAEGERERLYALDDAIKRIDEGTYGVCDECGISISKQRLKVMPQAKYCIECQEKEEKSAGR